MSNVVGCFSIESNVSRLVLLVLFGLGLMIVLVGLGFVLVGCELMFVESGFVSCCAAFLLLLQIRHFNKTLRFRTVTLVL
jgi:hypothetical protein